MSGLLLDTHVLVWLLEGNERLGQEARAAIQAAAETGTLHVSAITPWEIAMLVGKARLRFCCDVGEWMERALKLPGITLAPLSPAIAVASTRLPGEIHEDFADQIIVATARHLGAKLVTADALLLAYAKTGYLDVLEC
ncbi:MAG: type II toxin-antitoxin system VapC family toxin [Candidatus Accumulibacter sp.]|jgi:PIN domain nuclease of toxin-antitoxin system|nr:type II toxin-antitoxin system VapC family toxin [Accumulibacter sp.]